jgi:hypothetical protein
MAKWCSLATLKQALTQAGALDQISGPVHIASLLDVASPIDGQQSNAIRNARRCSAA